MKSLTPPTSDLKPWFKEPWPWIVMAGPAIVVVAALFTATLAFMTADEIVTDTVKPKPAVEASRNP